MTFVSGARVLFFSGWLFLGPGVFAAGAVPWKCSLDFASLPDLDEDQAQGLILTTYEQLLKSPAAASLDDAALSAMIAAKKPFRVPAPEQGDLSVLGRHLEEFEALIARKAWNSAGLEETLLASLVRLQLGRAAGQSAIEKAVIRTRPDFELPLSIHSQLIPIPGSNDFFLQSYEIVGRPHFHYPFYLVDGTTGKVTRSGAMRDHPSSPTVSASGQDLLYGGDQGVLWRVPITKGKPRWPRKKAVAEAIPDERRGLHGLQTVKGPRGDLVYAAWTSAHYPAFRFDLDADTRLPLNWDPLETKGRSIEAWGSLNGSTNLFVLVSQKKRTVLEEVAVSDDGVVSVVATRAAVNWHVEKVEWPHHAGPAYFHHAAEVRVALPGSPDAVPLLNLTKAKGPAAQIEDASAHPSGSSIAVLIVPRPKPGVSANAFDPYVEWFDAATQTSLANVPFPREFAAQTIRFLPDGRLEVVGAAGKHHRVLNLESRQ